eukprot:4628365-Pleurochrysis_carterae.AAC.2
MRELRHACGRAGEYVSASEQEESKRERRREELRLDGKERSPVRVLPQSAANGEIQCLNEDYVQLRHEHLKYTWRHRRWHTSYPH